MISSKQPVLFANHGGGPKPLLNDPAHASLTSFLKSAKDLLPIRPSAIILVTAHWEAKSPCISTSPSPSMLYDYGGFEKEAYKIEYLAPGPPSALTERATDLLLKAGMRLDKDVKRGYDHGTFVPLKLMFPEADIPVMQLSILSSLDPAMHFAMGEALRPLRDEGVLIIGSGSSFHDIQLMIPFLIGKGHEEILDAEKCSVLFDDWLVETCSMVGEDRKGRLINWLQLAPSARVAHPREEHLVPLFFVAGAASDDVGMLFISSILAKRCCQKVEGFGLGHSCSSNHWIHINYSSIFYKILAKKSLMYSSGYILQYLHQPQLTSTAPNPRHRHPPPHSWQYPCPLDTPPPTQPHRLHFPLPPPPPPGLLPPPPPPPPPPPQGDKQGRRPLEGPWPPTHPHPHQSPSASHGGCQTARGS